jgi:hypothetical protein
MNSKGQSSLEILIIFGILVLGSIIFGVFYFNSHQAMNTNKLDSATKEVASSLSYQKEVKPSSITCGNHLCEPGETCSNCESDCGACSIPEPTCGDGTCNGSEVCDECIADCGACTPPEPTCGGKGTIEDPKQICTPEDLYNIKDNPSWYYILNNDIDLNTTLLEKEIWYDKELGWLPIGNDKAPFVGSLDGKDFTIRNLYINRPEEDYIGLFGYAENANIKDLVFENALPTGNNSVGGLLGKCASGCTISNIHILTGMVTGNSIVGGLVGEINDSQITKSHTKMSIYCSLEKVGGLIGVSNNSIISESYSSGIIGSKELLPSIAGGLVGYLNKGAISNSHSTDTLNGNDFVGGLVGLNETGEISYCYSNAQVIGTENTGGLVAQIVPEIIDTSNYWDIDSSTQKESVMGTGYSTEEMKTQGVYIDWDFKNIWAIEEGNFPPYLINNPLK